MFLPICSALVRVSGVSSSWLPVKGKIWRFWRKCKRSPNWSGPRALDIQGEPERAQPEKERAHRKPYCCLQVLDQRVERR